jgi:hypothetical protein
MAMLVLRLDLAIMGVVMAAEVLFLAQGQPLGLDRQSLEVRFFVLCCYQISSSFSS